MKAIFTLSFAFVTLFITNISYALGHKGHQLVCEIAYQQLPTQQQQHINTLLGELPLSDKTAINRYLHRPLNEDISFAKSCTWADAIKREPEYKLMSSWHYINVTRDDQHVEPSDCIKNCITRAIDIHQQQLVSADNKIDQAKALMFLGHWLGDIHQPMHVNYKSDRGGNLTKIASNNDQCTNLHWIWDSCIIDQTNKSYTQLLALLTDELTSSDQSPWLNSNQWHWATESLAISRAPATNYCQLDNNNHCQPYDTSTPLKLKENYQLQHWPILKQRLLQASARLAQLLTTRLQ